MIGAIRKGINGELNSGNCIIMGLAFLELGKILSREPVFGLCILGA